MFVENLLPLSNSVNIVFDVPGIIDKKCLFGEEEKKIDLRAGH